MRTARARRWILAATILAVGLLQSWHSGVLQAGPLAWVLAAAGVLAAASAALAASARAGLLAAVLPSAALFLAAHWLSATPLASILAVPVAAGAMVLINERLELRGEGEPGPGAGGPPAR